MSAYRITDAEKDNYPISKLCRMLGVSRSGYYDYKDRPPSRRSQGEEFLTTKTMRFISAAEARLCEDTR